MNWHLILQLSLFGLAMGLATVFFIPSNIEPAFWFVIFLICAYVIARQVASNRFLHGVFLGLVNSVWITASHILFFNRYIATHTQEAEMMRSMPLSLSPRLMMALTGPMIGIISGLIIGVFTVIAGAVVKPSRRETQAPTT